MYKKVGDMVKDLINNNDLPVHEEAMAQSYEDAFGSFWINGNKPKVLW